MAKEEGDIERARALAEEAGLIAGRVGCPRWIKAIEWIRGDLG